MSKLLMVVAALAWIAGVLRMQAQIDERDSASVAATFGLTGSITRGTLNRTLVVGTIDAIARDSVVGTRVTVNGTYGTFGGLTTERDVMARMFGYVWTSKVVYPYAMMWMERSVRRSIAARWQPGVGATWVLVSDANFSVRVSATASYDVVEFVRVLPDGRRRLAQFRPIARVAARWRSTGAGLVASAEGWIQPSLQGTGIRQFLDCQVSAPLSQWLALRASVMTIDEPLIPAGASTYDLYASAGLALSL